MKKKIIAVFSVFIAIILVLVVIVYNNSYKNDVYVENKTNNKNKVPGLISLMLETKAGSGIYNVSPDGIVPAKGYELNTEKSGCENGGTITYNETTKKFILKSNISTKCYAYFDVVPPDVTLAITNRPTTYGKLGSINCTNSNATYNQKYNRVEISSIDKKYTSCTLNYTDSTSKVNLADYIIGLSGTTQGTGKVVNEIGQIKLYTDGNKLILSEYGNYVNDENYPFVWDSTNLTWKSDINSDGAVLNFELSEGEYKICYKSNIDNYEGAISIGDFYADSFTTSFQCEIATNAYDSSGSYISFINNNVDNGYIEFYLQKTTPNYEQVNAGIRYEGKNPNNYIWFNNEYWRIIGVFDSVSHGVSGKNLVKIIRAETLDGLAWDISSKNNWKTSSLKSLLNGAYYNAQDGTSSGYCYGYSTTATANCDYTKRGIQSGYRGMIASVTWHLGGYSSITSATSSDFYVYERGTTVYSGNATSTTGYIGLMYPSDYGYSVLSSSCARTTDLNSYGSGTCAGQSWLYGKGYEWTLTPNSSDSYRVYYWGNVIVSSHYASEGYGSRPVLYLDASVYKIDGDGSLKNPYIVGM